MKLRNLPLYICALYITLFMLQEIIRYNTEAIEASSSADASFIDVSNYTEEDALLAFAPAKEENSVFFYPFDKGKIHAFAAGVVTQAAADVIVISHSNELSTRYLGCIERRVNEDEKIAAGTIIADMGDDTCFEVLFRGKVVDASLYLTLTARS